MTHRVSNNQVSSGGIHRLKSLVGKLFTFFATIGTIWIFGLMLLIVVDVFGRNVLGAPIIGVSEIAARSVGAILFLLLPYAAIEGKLIQADFLIRILGKRNPALVASLETLFSVAGILMFLAIAYASWPDMVSALESSEFFGVQGVWTLPVFPFKALLFGGAISTAIGFVFASVAPWLNHPWAGQAHE